LLDDPTTITGVSARKTQCTIVACPAPLSQGLSYEAAANVAVLLSNILASSPHLDVMNSDYPDMPMPLNGVVPAMTDYNVRDTYVKAGCSTVDVSAGVYKIKDLVTTYRPDGETPPQYRYVRDLFIDFNIEYGWKLRVKSKFVAHTLCDDNATVTADNIVKPKMVVAEGYSYAIELSNRALIADAKFMQQSMSAAINSTNPNRLDVNYSYQRTGMTRIVSTTAKAGFNFGNA
jgi:phage tail sheath gpL-like